METATLIGLGTLLFGWAFNAGKRHGSKKSYFVGQKRANRKKNRTGKRRNGWWT